MTTLELSAPSSDLNPILQELSVWQQENRVNRLWNKDASLWTNSDEQQWLGWLNLPNTELSEIDQITKLAQEIKKAGIKHCVVLGMGGSSLCPEMLAKTFGKINGYPSLHILDTTDPQQICDLEKAIDLSKTLFIVSSKSGTTLETIVLYQYFSHQLQKSISAVGDHFIAITDPGTELEKLAKGNNFKAIFYGVPSVGGRYSALSNFGMVPAGLMGINLTEFLAPAVQMHHSCAAKNLVAENTSVTLGIILGVLAKNKKDKVTFIISPTISNLGAWFGQLLAESTGKDEKGLIPIDGEPLGDVSTYSQDRVFIYLRLNEEPDQQQDQAVAELTKAGFPVIRLQVPTLMHLGAELYRWKIATAVASSILRVNPFNQPDVEATKVRSLQLLHENKSSPLRPLLVESNIKLFADEANANEINNLLSGEANIKNYLFAHLRRAMANDYLNLSAFLAMSDENLNLLQEIRKLIRNKTKLATTLGFGPRFLHSTGQLHKGGSNNTVILQITTDHAIDLSIPNRDFTFGTLINAQAEADFAVLASRSRRILRVHIGNNVVSGLKYLQQLVARVTKGNPGLEPGE